MGKAAIHRILPDVTSFSFAKASVYSDRIWICDHTIPFCSFLLSEAHIQLFPFLLLYVSFGSTTSSTAFKLANLCVGLIANITYLLCLTCYSKKISPMNRKSNFWELTRKYFMMYHYKGSMHVSHLFLIQHFKDYKHT